MILRDFVFDSWDVFFVAGMTTVFFTVLHVVRSFGPYIVSSFGSYIVRPLGSYLIVLRLRLVLLCCVVLWPASVCSLARNAHKTSIVRVHLCQRFEKHLNRR